MKKYIYIFLVATCLILLVGCNKKDIKYIKEDGTLILQNQEVVSGYNYKSFENPDFFTENLYKNQFFIKKENKKVSEITDDAMFNFDYIYLNQENKFLYVDRYKDLNIISKNNIKNTIGEDVAIEENCSYDLDFGCIDRFNSFLYPEIKIKNKAYGTSKNGKTIAYIDLNLDFFIIKDNSARKHIDKNVSSFTLDYFGENVYYIKNKNQLYLYRNKQSKKIASGVKNFFISKDGNNVVWIDNNYNVYTKNVSDNTINKICNSKDGIYAVIGDDNSIIYTKGNSKTLYRYLNQKNIKIDSDIIGFCQYKNKIYYINVGNNLFEIDIKDNYKKSNIKSNIKNFILSNSKLYFLDYDNNIYKKENNENLTKIASNVDEDYSIIENDIVYKKYNAIYVNNKKIADRVKAFCFNSSYIAYVDSKDRVHIYDVKNKKDSIQIKNAKKYAKIYLGNNLLYKSTLEFDNINEIAGYWYSEEPFNFDNKKGNLIKFEPNNKVTFFYNDNTKKSYDLTIDKDYGCLYFSKLNTSDEISFTIRDIELKKISLIINNIKYSYGYDFKKISNDEASKKINEIKLMNKN